MAALHHGEDLSAGIGYQSDESREALRNKFISAVLHKRAFVVGVMGTSVTAG